MMSRREAASGKYLRSRQASHSLYSSCSWTAQRWFVWPMWARCRHIFDDYLSSMVNCQLRNTLSRFKMRQPLA